MGDENNENKKGFFSTLKDKGLSIAWKRLPIIVRLKIIGVVASITLFLILMIALTSYIPHIFLNYSTDFDTDKEFKEEYEEYWGEFCDENNCSESQLEQAEKLKKSQEAFYDKFKKLSEKENLNEEQKYMVLTTIFFEFYIDDFYQGNAFELDSTDEIDYDNVISADQQYKQDADSLKELIKQFKVHTVSCHTKDEEGNESSYKLTDGSGNPFNLNTFERAFFKFGIYIPEGLDSAVSSCKNREDYSGITVEKEENGQASNENYFRYLENSEYFDNKFNLRRRYTEYANLHDLDYKNIASWSEENKKDVRKEIIKDIKKIIAEHIKEEKELLAFTDFNGYLWPIGSDETFVDEAGHKLAVGAPTSLHITSYFGGRWGKQHKGIDIGAVNVGQTNIISVTDGTVKVAITGCSSYGSYGSDCGGGFGNYVRIIDDKTQNVITYAHMASNSITVKTGDKVVAGQIIGKAGSSGSSTGPHLHFQIDVGTVAVDPLTYVSRENPRPVIISDKISVVSYMFKRLISDGYTPEAAVGVLGNIEQESGANPLAQNKSSGAFGICQWLSGRYDSLVNYSNSKNQDYRNAKSQIDFFFEVDLPAQKDFFKKRGYTIDEFKEITDIDTATKIFMKAFERPGDAEAALGNRTIYAKKWYDRFVNGSMDQV